MRLNEAAKFYKIRLYLTAVLMARWSYPGSWLERSKSQSATQIDDHISRWKSRRLEQRLQRQSVR